MKQVRKAGHGLRWFAAGSLAVAAAVCSAVALAQPAQAEDATTYTLYPTPQVMTYDDGTITLGETVDVVVEDGIDNDTVARLNEALDLKGITSEEATAPDADGQVDVLVGIEGSGDVVDKYVDTAGLTIEEGLFEKTDAYLLALTPASEGNDARIVVLGKDTDSAFYGLTTVYQLFQQVDGDTVRAFTISDWADVVSRGFIEGYYGNPWSQEDREELMRWGGYHKLNVYVYAPKDDNNHRLQWRHMYDDEGIKKIEALAAAGNESKCRFVYALLPFYAPGEIDSNTEESLGVKVDAKFNFSNYAADLEVLKARYLQVIDAGVRQIALLADDAKDMGGQNYLRLLEDLTAWLEELQEETNEDGTLKYPGLKTTIPYVGAQWTYTGTGEAWYKDAPASVQFVVTGGQTFGSVNADFIGKVQAATGRNPFMWINWPCTDPLPNYLTMGGHNTFLEDGVQPGSVDGIMLNPMQQSQPSKQGIFMVSDYAWNLWDSEDHANQVWQDSFSYLEDNSPNATEASDALRELSMHMRMSTAGTTNSTYPTPDYSASVPGQTRSFSFWINDESVDFTGKTDPAGAMTAIKEAVEDGSVTAEDIAAARPTYQSIVDAANTYEKSHTNETMWSQISPFIKALRDKAQASLLYLDVIEAALDYDDAAAEKLETADAMYDQSKTYTYNQLGTDYEARAGHEYVEPTLESLRTAATNLVYATSEIPAEDMTVTAGSEELPGNTSEGPASFAADENESTFWSSEWDGDEIDNLWLQIAFDEPTSVSALRYLPRQTTGDVENSGSCNGTVTEYKVLYSNDGTDWQEAAEGSWSDYTDKSWRTAAFDTPVTAKYFRLQAVHTFMAGGEAKYDTGMSCAEIRLLSAPEVDLTKLEAAIAKAEGLNAADYTEASWAALQEALTAAKGAQTSFNQTAIDTAAANLEAAINALVGAAPADGTYTEANPFVFPAEGETATLEFEYGQFVDDHTNDNGWPMVKLETLGVTTVDAVNLGDEIHVPFSVKTPGTYSVTLQFSSGSTTNALAWSDDAGIIAAGNTDAGADDAAGALHTATFTMTASGAGESTLVFGARDEGKAPRLDKLTITLEKATEPEPSEPDYAALQAAIDEAEALKSDDYTAESWTKVESALADAKAALESDSQDEVDAAAEALTDAVAALVKAEPEPAKPDYAALQAAIEAAEALKSDDYTADSWAKVESALAAAREALSATDQNAVNAAAEALNAAIDALVEAEPEPAKPDYAALQAAIDEAGALKADDYTAESWDAFQEALDTAKAVLDDPDATQAEVDSALAALQAAEKALVASEPGTDEPDPDEPGTDPDKPGTDEPGTDPDKPGTDEPGDTTDPGDQKPGDTTKPGGSTTGGSTTGGSTSGGGLAQTGDPTSVVAALATALAGAGALVASRKRR